MHLGPFVRDRGHQIAIEHRELGGLDLDDNGIVTGRDHFAVEGIGINGEAECRYLWLIIEYAILEASCVTRHVTCDQRRHQGLDEERSIGISLRKSKDSRHKERSLWVE